MRWVTAVLQRHSTTDGLVTMWEEVPLGKTYEVDLDSIEIVDFQLTDRLAKARGHTHHRKEIISCKPRVVDGLEVREHLCTELLYIPGHNSKHIYTHKDKDGVLWRFEGGRPISKLADEVMDGLGFNQEK
jgi:hypothetical protein